MTARIALVAAAVTAGLLVPVSPAHAATSVMVDDFAFTPDRVRVALGGDVEWTFVDATSHTSTSDQGFWHSGPKSSGGTFTAGFESAGSFGYHCEIHGHSMSGVVQVRVAVSGSPADGWRLRWATGSAPDDRVYDVQVRRRGAERWRDLRVDTAKRSGRFDPAKTGTWRVRARTGAASGATSGWAPPRSVKVS